MKAVDQQDPAGRAVSPSYASADTDPDDVAAWECLGDGLWLPRRVRGSNRGRPLG